MLAPSFESVVARPGASANGSKSTATPHVPKTSNKTAESTCIFDQARDENLQLVQHMRFVLQNSQRQMVRLHSNMSRTYWLLITLSTLMFLIGAAFISAPLWSSFTGDSMDLSRMLSMAGIGVTDLVVLYMLRPWLHIKKLMADMSQLTLAGDCFQLRVALRLLGVDSEKRASFREASDYIEDVTEDAVKMIKTYFEKELDKELAGEPHRATAVTPARAGQ